MSAIAKIRTISGIANGHWEPTERRPFTLRPFEGGGLRRLLQLLVRPSAAGQPHPPAENGNAKHG
ncbi:MAG TPA: hypothetical protein VEQ58_14670 [Polyangiaceae bacterium]|nr:hypothetical protein [Polyangiaceae bacterium]